MDTKGKPELHAVDVTSDHETRASSAPRLGKVVRELRQRKVCRAAITYVLILWLNLQIGDVLFPLLGLPDWTLLFVMFIGIMGLPVVLLLAWLFQITPSGVVLDVGSTRPETASERYLEPTVSVLLLVMSFALTLLLAMQFLDTRTQEAATASNAIVSTVAKGGALECATTGG